MKHNNIEEETPKGTISSVHAFVIKGQEILVTNNVRGLDIPGGHIEGGEDCSTALKREILEETDVKIPKDANIEYIAKINLADSKQYPTKSMLFAIIILNDNTTFGKWMKIDKFLSMYSQKEFEEVMKMLLNKVRDYIK